jgi:hypothetical protein
LPLHFLALPGLLYYSRVLVYICWLMEHVCAHENYAQYSYDNVLIELSMPSSTD